MFNVVFYNFTMHCNPLFETLYYFQIHSAPYPSRVLSSLISSQVMSLSPSDDDPTMVLDEREPVVSNLKEAFPVDVKIKVSDGEVWANKALLCANSEYFSAMLDGEKFKEGKEGIGDLEKYTKVVVNKLIHYFYSGQMSCKVKFEKLLFMLKFKLDKIKC